MVTDATCYMEWIAEQYGLELEESYRQRLRDNPNPRCTQSWGDINDVNKAGTECRFRNNIMQDIVMTRLLGQV